MEQGVSDGVGGERRVCHARQCVQPVRLERRKEKVQRIQVGDQMLFLVEAAFISTGVIALASCVACWSLRERELRVRRLGDKFSEPCSGDARIKTEPCMICLEPLAGCDLAQCITCHNITHLQCLHDHLMFSARHGRPGRCIMGCE